MERKMGKGGELDKCGERWRSIGAKVEGSDSIKHIGDCGGHDGENEV